ARGGLASRWTGPISLPRCSTAPGFRAPKRVAPRYGLADRPDRPHFDAADTRWRDPRREMDRLVEVCGLDHVEAGKLLLGLGEGAVGDRHLAAAHTHGGRGPDRLQRLRGETVAARPDCGVVGDAVFVG